MDQNKIENRLINNNVFVSIAVNQSKPVLHEQMLFPMETVLQDLRWMLLLANDQMCTITKLEEENHDGVSNREISLLQKLEFSFPKFCSSLKKSLNYLGLARV